MNLVERYMWVPSGVEILPAKAGSVPVEWTKLKRGNTNAGVLFYMHGGGFVMGSPRSHRLLVAHLARLSGVKALSVDYRLAPEHPFPAGLQDCIQAYRWMRMNSPTGSLPTSAAFIAGDSAGGGLTLSTMLALRDRRLPLPNAAICISPFSDLTLSGESIRSEGGLDMIMHPSCLPDFVNRYVSDADVRNPLASPVFGDYTNIPPLLIQVGEHEIIRDDSVRTAAKARAVGCEVTLEVYEGMFHVFQSHEPLLPEAVEAIAHIASFMQANLGVENRALA